MIYDVTGNGKAGVYLAAGEENLLFDTGMAYCAGKMIENVESRLRGGELTAVFLTHSHYDHVAGLPYLRKRWPKLKVYASGYAKKILEKPTALKTIRELSVDAAADAGSDWEPDYEDRDLRVDEILHDGQIIETGGHQIKVLDSPGHTRCSVSYLIDRDTLFCSESIGVFSKSGVYMPAFLVGYQEAWKTVRVLEKQGAKRIILPHAGVIDLEENPDIWKKFLEKMEYSKDIMIRMVRSGKSEADQIWEMEPCFRDEFIKKGQPDRAYYLNAASMLKTIEREFPEKAAS